jgi:hypothetical protein
MAVSLMLEAASIYEILQDCTGQQLHTHHLRTSHVNIQNCRSQRTNPRTGVANDVAVLANSGQSDCTATNSEFLVCGRVVLVAECVC